MNTYYIFLKKKIGWSLKWPLIYAAIQQGVSAAIQLLHLFYQAKPDKLCSYWVIMIYILRLSDSD